MLNFNYFYSCPPTCSPCDPPQQDPEIPEWPYPKPDDEEVKEDPLRFPILSDLRERLVNSGILPEQKPGYPADIIIRWKDN